MRTRRIFSLTRVLIVLVFIALVVPQPLQTTAQPAGATLTVLRGTVGVLQASGTAVQPAASGMTLGPGDQVATLANGGALITFFEGSEIELGQNATIIIRQLSGTAARANITLETVIGSTVHRVVSFTDPGSSYRVESQGTVALVRGTVFGHSADGDIVTVALQRCDPILPMPRAKEECMEFPEGVPLREGRVRSVDSRGDVNTEAFDTTQPLFNVVANPVQASGAATGTENAGIQTGSRSAPQQQSLAPSGERDEPSATATPTTGPTPTFQAVSCFPSGGAHNFDVFNINIPAGTLLIDMRGSNSGGGTLFDPFLVLYRPSFNSSNPCADVAAADDDSGGGFPAPFDARIQVNAQGGNYVIVATNFSPGQLGTYTLTATVNGSSVLNTTGNLVAADPTFNRPNPGARTTSAIVEIGGRSRK